MVNLYGLGVCDDHFIILGVHQTKKVKNLWVKRYAKEANSSLFNIWAYRFSRPPYDKKCFTELLFVLQVLVYKAKSSTVRITDLEKLILGLFD